MTPEFMAIALVAGHALADYPLQGDFLARAKNRTAPIAGFPWWQEAARTLLSTARLSRSSLAFGGYSLQRPQFIGLQMTRSARARLA